MSNGGVFYYFAFLWLCLLGAVVVVSVLHSAYLFFFNKKSRARTILLYKEIKIDFIEYSSVTFSDVVLLLINTCRIRKLNFLFFLLNLFTALCCFYVFYLFLIINIIIIALTVVINLNNSIIICANHLQMNESLVRNKYFSLTQILIFLFQNLWTLSKCFSFILIYKLFKKKIPIPSIDTLHKIALSALCGFPWFILIFSCELTNSSNFNLEKKSYKIKCFLYVKHFISNLNFFIAEKLFKIRQFVVFLKIKIKNFRIKSNPDKEAMLALIKLCHRHNSLLRLDAPAVWPIRQPISNGRIITYNHQIFYNSSAVPSNPQTQSTLAMVLTSSKYLKINQIEQPTMEFSKYFTFKGYKTQYCVLSGIISNNITTNNFLASVWENHGLDDQNTYIGFLTKLNLMYYLSTLEYFPLQYDTTTNSILVKFLHGSQNIAAAEQFILATLQQNNLSTWKLTQQLQNYSSFKAWYVSTQFTNNTKSQFLTEIYNTPSVNFFNALTELSATDVNMLHHINTLVTHHANAITNYYNTD